jgi:hypothetical protein
VVCRKATCYDMNDMSDLMETCFFCVLCQEQDLYQDIEM